MPQAEFSHVRRAAALFRKTLSPVALHEIARGCRFVQRQRTVTACSVFWALMTTLGAHPTQYISDVLRSLNAQQGWSLRYKPFWDRLAKRAFCVFMKTLFERLCREMTMRVLGAEVGSVANCFSDILMDDGSSFAVADGLRRAFPGRFTKVTPAAVELHAHMSLLSGNVRRVTLAPDKEAERQFLPPASSLARRSLSLRDRGYVDIDYFEELSERETYLICRATNELNPTIVEVISGLPKRVGKRWVGKRLQELRKKKLRHDLDLLVSWPRKGGRTIELRLCIRYVVEKKSWTWLLTNLPRTFAASSVGQLYRLRWQIELLFKDWKSYANLHALQTEHPAIVEGFIWASLCAAFLKRVLAHWAQLVSDGRAISTRIAAQAGPQILPLLALFAARGFRVARLAEILLFLANNAIRTHPERRKRGHGHALGLRDLPGRVRYNL
jgi:hypothetical protein